MSNHIQQKDKIIRNSPHPVEIDIGRRIKFYRRSYNIAIEVMAFHTGVSADELKNYEEGKGKINCRTLWIFSCFLRVPIEKLIKPLKCDHEKYTGLRSDYHLMDACDDILDDPCIYSSDVNLKLD